MIDNVFEGNDSGGRKLPRSSKKRTKRQTTTIKKETETKKIKSATKVNEKRKSTRTASLLDTRKITKKGIATLRDKWSVAKKAGSRDSLMEELLSNAKEKFGVSNVFGSRDDLEQLAIGIPMPSLAFEYLLANDIFPLSVVMMLAGSWNTCKSALSYEIFRWFHELSGIIVHIDTELKFDAEFACDIMRVPPDATPFISNRALSLEKYQQILTYYLKEVQKTLIGTKEQPGPGKTVPCCFCLDSLAGGTSEEIQEKILKEGNANRTHPINALKNTLYLSGIKKQFDGWPFTLLVINHLKNKTDDMGNTFQSTLGGEAFNFHESCELRNSTWKTKFKNSQFGGKGIRIKCVKNSFGIAERSIKTRFLWWVDDDEVTGKPKDMFMWDWNWTICNMLYEMDGKEKARLKERGLVLNAKSPKADVECLANMPILGMGKSEYLPYQEVGQMIHDNDEVSDLIRDALNIKRRYYLDRPYDEIVDSHKQGAS